MGRTHVVCVRLAVRLPSTCLCATVIIDNIGANARTYRNLDWSTVIKSGIKFKLQMQLAPLSVEVVNEVGEIMQDFG